MSRSSVSILMYHSISEGPGPTRIAPDLFRRQMALLEQCGYSVVSLGRLPAWLDGLEGIPERVAVLTFDDGFEDFATVAFPELKGRGWTATVFVPTAKLGAVADWERSAGNGRAARLMSWPTVRELSRLGIEFGAHGVSHADLTKLSPELARAEIVESKRALEQHVERPVRSFAAPYGKTNGSILREVGKHFQVAVGTGLARAHRRSDRYDLPRIEMWYFRNMDRWRSFLDGAARGYFLLRQTLRRVRALVT
jgi:peptidoglycan/xylan/chitin deacetylase (PgdA/CDA1 family)